MEILHVFLNLNLELFVERRFFVVGWSLIIFTNSDNLHIQQQTSAADVTRFHLTNKIPECSGRLGVTDWVGPICYS